MKWFKKPAIEETAPAAPTIREVLQEAVDAALKAHGEKVRKSRLFQSAAAALENGGDLRISEVLIEMLAYNWSRPDLPEADEAGLVKILEALLAYRRGLNPGDRQ
jgi:hypothetical protein